MPDALLLRNPYERNPRALRRVRAAPAPQLVIVGIAFFDPFNPRRRDEGDLDGQLVRATLPSAPGRAAADARPHLAFEFVPRSAQLGEGEIAPVPAIGRQHRLEVDALAVQPDDPSDPAHH